jgi:hypothetical protein
MTPNEAALLRQLRLDIKDRQEQLEAFSEGSVILTNDRGEDIAPAMVAELQRQIARLEEVVAKHDPEGFTVLTRAFPA